MREQLQEMANPGKLGDTSFSPARKSRRYSSLWRMMVAIVLYVCVLRTPLRLYAEEVAVPLPMQVQLLTLVADYDKGFTGRAKGKTKIVLLTSKKPDSERALTQVQTALAQIRQIAGQPHEESTIVFESGAALTALCRTSGVSIVFLMPGLQNEIAEIKRSLDGLDVLSVASIGSYVHQGIVLGFDVVSGKPKLLVNLDQAHSQKISFRSELLKMVRVVD
jgi:hypothetical protein